MTTPTADTGPAPAPRRPWYRRRRYRIRAFQVSLLTVVAVFAGLAATDRANITTNQRDITVQQVALDTAVTQLRAQQADLDRQRRYDCLLFAGVAFRTVPDTAPTNEQCIPVAAAAAVDNGGCLPARPVRPDLDTSETAISACLAALARQPAPPAPAPSPAQTPGR